MINQSFAVCHKQSCRKRGIMQENYLIVICVTFIFFVLLYFYTKKSRSRNEHEEMPFSYEYGDENGPNTWKSRFRIGENQSPISIISVCTVTVSPRKIVPLDFTEEHHITPVEMKLRNDGHTVVLSSSWADNRSPIICGGPLSDEYKLSHMCFRWGPNDQEGTEHMIDLRRYGMELQVTYKKRSCRGRAMSKILKICPVTIISYMFEVTEIDNQFLESIIHALKFIKKPYDCATITPFPPSLLIPAFSRRYFTYEGSLTYPPCTEGVKWIIQPEALTISSHQLSQFRKLIGFNGFILSNIRPVQNINNRTVHFYE